MKEVWASVLSPHAPVRHFVPLRSKTLEDGTAERERERENTLTRKSFSWGGGGLKQLVGKAIVCTVGPNGSSGGPVQGLVLGYVMVKALSGWGRPLNPKP